MKPISLRLVNFRGIKSGLNRDEISLDLSHHFGLVAIVGPTGTGKTTLLDNMHPWRVMPFRAKGYSEKQTSYYEETFGDAEKDFVFEHEGKTFRSQLLIHNSEKTASTKAYLFVRTGDKWAAYTAPDGTSSDGKSATYDRCVHSLLGTPEVFFTAHFASQERKRLADYPAGDMKLLMSELLSLDHLLELSKQAAGRASRAQASIELLQPEIRAYEQAIADADTHQIAITSAEASVAEANAARSVAQQTVTQAGRALIDAQAREAGRAENARRRALLQQQADELEQEITDAKQRLERELAAAEKHGAALDVSADITALTERRTQLLLRHEDALRTAANFDLPGQPEAIDTDICEAYDKLLGDLSVARMSGAGKEVAADIARLIEQRDQLHRRIEDAQVRADASDDAQSASDDLASAKATLAEADTRIAVAKAEVARLADAPAALAERRERRSSLAASGRTLRAMKDAAQLRADLVQRVPCAGMAISHECELLADARTAGAEAETHAAEFERQRAEFAILETELAAAITRDQHHSAAVVALAGLEMARTTTLQLAVDAAQVRVQAAAAAVEILASIDLMRADLAAVEGQLIEKRALQLSLKVDADARAQQLANDFNTAQIRRAARLQDEISSATHTLIAKQTLVAAKRAEGQQRALVANDEHAAAAKLRDQRLKSVTAELAAVPADADLAEVATAQLALTNAETAQRTADAQLADAQRGVAVAEAAHAAALLKVESGKAAADSLTAVTEDLAQWRLLAKALGKDGIVALAIDDSGPAISTIANELLLECYGPRFSLRFDTQSETAKGVLKEDFDIICFDGERSEEKSVLKTSGGERVMLNDAITRAIALFKARQAGAHIRAIFSDETEGGLDEQKKVHAFRMKRAVLKRGGYDVEYCITHTRELWDLADSVLDVGLLRAT